MADTLDVLTLTEAQQELNAADSDLTDLAAWVTAVSRRLDEICGPIVDRTYTSEAYNGSTSAIAVSRLKIRHTPVSSITSVIEYDQTTSTTLTAETNSAKTDSNYFFDSNTGFLYRRNNGYDYPFPVGLGNVLVTYVGGRAASTSAVDAQIKEAAKRILQHWWKQARGIPTQTFGDVTEFVPAGFAVPNAALEVLGDLKRVPGIA